MLPADLAHAPPAAGAAARAGDYEGRVTFKVIMACMIAATGGLLFGYDLGVTGKPVHKRIMESYILSGPVLACAVNGLCCCDAPAPHKSAMQTLKELSGKSA